MSAGCCAPQLCSKWPGRRFASQAWWRLCLRLQASGRQACATYLPTCLCLPGTSALLQGKVMEYKDGMHIIEFVDGQIDVSCQLWGGQAAQRRLALCCPSAWLRLPARILLLASWQCGKQQVSVLVLAHCACVCAS